MDSRWPKGLGVHHAQPSSTNWNMFHHDSCMVQMFNVAVLHSSRFSFDFHSIFCYTFYCTGPEVWGLFAGTAEPTDAWGQAPPDLPANPYAVGQHTGWIHPPRTLLQSEAVRPCWPAHAVSAWLVSTTAGTSRKSLPLLELLVSVHTEMSSSLNKRSQVGLSLFESSRVWKYSCLVC